MRSRAANAEKRRFPWAGWTDAKLLDMRLCDLGVRLDDGWVVEVIDRVRGELAARDLRVQPHFWLSEEWFSPAGVPGVAVPFYLAHPRLIRLERRQMLEAEGATRASCTRLVRHELGHAVQHAYRLHRRRRWQQHFGRSSKPYPDVYRPNPASRRHVLHLDYWYAQAHPDEDFAETFAVWLTPGGRWKSRYKGWPVLRKLEYVDELMRELAGRRPPVRSRARPEHLPYLQRTLAEYYEEKRTRFAGLTSNVYDADLLRIFGTETEGGVSAAAFLRNARGPIRRRVARGTGRHEYAIDVVLREMTVRCRELGLRVAAPDDELVNDLAVLVAARGVEYVYRRREWHAM